MRIVDGAATRLALPFATLMAASRDKPDADVRPALAEPDIQARFETFAFADIGRTPQQIERQAQPKSAICAGRVKRKSISRK